MMAEWAEFLGRNGWPRDLSPWAILDQWDSLVDQAWTGYWSGHYEFSNDLAVRDLLAKALVDESLATFAQSATMKQRVEAADARFRSAVMPGVEIGQEGQPWWHRAVLARSGDEYADDMARLYDVEVSRVDGTSGT